MLATLHGLTRSRPDLLTESMATFATFAAPSRMPKDEIGAHLEAKLAEGEVLREFERIPKRKIPSGVGYEQLFRTSTLAENVPLNRLIFFTFFCLRLDLVFFDFFERFCFSNFSKNGPRKIRKIRKEIT
jgi:hypothetical protein